MKKKMIAAIIACTMAMTTMPSVAFAGTDYEAAYNQAHAQAQTAYEDLQNAIADRDAKEIAYNHAKAEAAQAETAIEPAYQDMLKKQRLLDLKTRQAVESMSETDYKNDFGPSTSTPERYKTQSRIDYIVSSNYQFYNANSYAATPAKLKALQAHLNSKTSSDNAQWNTPGKYWRANNPNNKQSFPQGFTTSTSGNDDTASLTLYQKYVYYNQSYNLIMLDLDYFDECNQIRQKEGKSPVKVSSYMMLQATVNAPMNIYGHNVLTNVSGHTCSQNLIGPWGELNCYTTNYRDPFSGWYWSEKPTNGGHYRNLIGNHTHSGIACSVTTSAFDDSSFPSNVCEQDFYNRSSATGYTVAAYRKMINDKVAGELSAYNNAKKTYEKTQADADTKSDDAQELLYDYADAKTEVAYAKTDYNIAVRAEQKAYENWQNWFNNNTGNDEPENPGTADPGATTEPTNPEQAITSVGDVTGLTVSGYKDGNEYVINVSWAAATNANAYEVYEKVGSGSYAYKTTTSSRSVQFTTTSAKTAFTYQVRGLYKDNKTSVYGNVTTSSVYTTPAAESQPVNLAKATNVKIRQTGWNDLTKTNTVRVSWSAVANAKRYNVYKSINGGNFTLADIVGSDTLGLTINTVPYSGTIRCKVAAEDANGNEGPMSDVATLKTSDGSIDIDFNTDPGEQTQPTKPTQPSNPGEQTQPTKPTNPTPVYAKSYVKSFKVVKGKKSFTAKWQKQSKANQKKFKAYQIRYSTKKSMKGAKYVTVKRSAKSKKIKRLKARKTYYVQARTYKDTGGKKVYSKWTKIRVVKTK